MTRKLLAVIASVITVFCCTAGICIASTQLNNEEKETIEPLEITTQVETKEDIEEKVIVIIPDEVEKPKVQKVAKCQVNVRDRASLDSEILQVLPRGTEIGILEESNGWYKVNIENKDCFVYSENLISKEDWELIKDVPYSDQVPLSADIQQYLWNECQDLGIKYCFALGVISVETGDTFDPTLISRTNDWGIMQVNKCWHKTFKKMGYITCSEDLLNPYNGIHCGLWVLNDAVQKYGNCERAYAYYNTGNSGVHSNANSRKVVNRWEMWKGILGDI